MTRIKEEKEDKVRIFLQDIIEDLRFEDLPANWNSFDLKSFSGNFLTEYYPPLEYKRTNSDMNELYEMPDTILKRSGNYD